jgi:GNAT superfamily N-acetyltransferase
MKRLKFVSIALNEQREFRANAHKETSALTFGAEFKYDLIERELSREAGGAANDPETGMVAYLGENPVGIVTLEEHEDGGGKLTWVRFFYVAPEFRGMGIGKQLLKYAENFARKRGHSSIRLRSSALNSNAINFYKRGGFVHVVGGDKISVGGIALPMFEKMLD